MFSIPNEREWKGLSNDILNRIKIWNILKVISDFIGTYHTSCFYDQLSPPHSIAIVTQTSLVDINFIDKSQKAEQFQSSCKEYSYF